MNYDYTSTERQRRYVERMRKAGFKKISIWVKKKEPKYGKMSITEFIKKLRKLTKGWSIEDLSQLFILYIRIAKSKKEVK